ncbi:MAG: hypothetical protein ABIO70_24655 [Pseudomonadota bacterium]
MKPQTVSLEITLALLAGLTVLLTAGHPPEVDEEVYLDLARQILAHPALPYAWERAMQPWEGGSFLFAHPPLHWSWVAACMSVFGDSSPVILRLVAGLPPALLLGWSAGRLARRTVPEPGLAAAAWLLSPVTLLALAAGLMVDLTAVALASAGVAAWREALEPHGRRLQLVLAGLLLGLALGTKYPMVVAALAVALHAWRLGLMRAAWPLWLALGLTWGGVELWIGLGEGAFHPWVVLAHAGDIARGPLLGRLLGTLARAGLALAPLLWLGKRRLLGAAILAAFFLAIALPPELSPGQLAFLGGCTFLGSLWAVQAGAALVAAWRLPDLGTEQGPVARVDAADSLRRHDDLLLGAWALGTLLAVGFGHNYAAGRYLLPAILPLACLVGRHARPRALAGPLLGVWAVLAVVMVVAAARYAWALQGLAEQVNRQGKGFFTGEWAFRATLDRAGWEPVVPGQEWAAGALVATPTSAGVGPLPWERLTPVDHLEATDRFPLRLADQAAAAGWYGETLGPLPLGWSFGPLERVELYRVSGEGEGP